MAALSISDIRAGDVVKLQDGQTITVDGVSMSYTDAEGEHAGPFVTDAKTFTHHPIADVVEVVERNERECRYCGGGVTSPNPQVDYCRMCFYTGRSQQGTFDELCKRLTEASNGREWGVWHTGGGCFCLGMNLTENTTPNEYDGIEVMASDYSVLPETVEGPWLVGAYRWSDGNDFPDWEAASLNADQLVEHVRDRVAAFDTSRVRA